MAARPTAERKPPGLGLYWSHVWERALKAMKDQGSWAWEQRPLLDEYVHALMAAEATRGGFAWLDHLQEVGSLDEVDMQLLRQIAGGLPTQWDRHVKRAARLADQLALTPRGRKAAGIGNSDKESEVDPFAAFADELAQRRRAG